MAIPPNSQQLHAIATQGPVVEVCWTCRGRFDFCQHLALWAPHPLEHIHSQSFCSSHKIYPIAIGNMVTNLVHQQILEARCGAAGILKSWPFSKQTTSCYLIPSAQSGKTICIPIVLKNAQGSESLLPCRLCWCLKAT